MIRTEPASSAIPSNSSSSIVQEEDADGYVRRMNGPALLVAGEPATEAKIGEVELICFNGSRAIDNGAPIELQLTKGPSIFVILPQ